MNLVLTGGLLIDGNGGPPIENAALQIQDGRIVWAGPAVELPAAAQALPQEDVSGKVIMPGLIDAHCHVCWNGRESVLELIEKDRDLILLEATDTLLRILQTGTTTVRDIGGHNYVEMSLRKAVEAGWIVGPRLKTSGTVISMTGGHGYFIAREADGPEEVRKAAREQIKAGADTIKLMATGGGATPGQDVMASQLTVEEMRAAVEAAHSMGRTTATHCHGTGGIKASIEAGVDSIEHGTFLDEETAEMMAEHGTALVLTLGVAKPDPNTIPPDMLAEAQRLTPIFERLSKRTSESIQIARDKGVFIGIGSDAGGNALAPHDFSMANEVEQLVENGFTPLEAITIATKNNAKVLCWDDEIGTLEVGKFADVLVLDANPLDNIRNLRAVSAVYKGGVLV